jgi:hypothetical protein
LQNAMLSWDSDIERAPISKQTSDEFLLWRCQEFNF